MFANKPFANASSIYHVTAAVDIHMGPATLKALSTQFRFRSFKFADPRSDYQEETKVIQQLPIIQIQVASLSEPNQHCPYDPSNYRSFSKVERSCCSFCGMRPPKSPFSVSCDESRSESAHSHMRPALGKRTDLTARREVTIQNASLPQHSSSSEEGPRLVPPEIAAKRIGNPPRKAALPIQRSGAVNDSLTPPSDQRSSQSLENRITAAHANVPRRRKSALEQNDDYPYVLKSEVSQHLDAIRAGEPSPLIDFACAARLKKASDRMTDFSETVFYGQKFSAAFGPIPEQHSSLQPPRSTLIVERSLDTGGHVVIARPRPEQQASINALLHSGDKYSRRATHLSQQNSLDSRPSSNNRRRTRHTSSRAAPTSNDQPSDFQEGLSDDIIPKLRGGFATCYRPGHGYATDSDNDENLPPARTLNLAEIARASRQAHGISRLPKGISRRGGSQETSRVGKSAAGSGHVTNLLPSRTPSFAATHSQPRSMFFHLPTFGLTSTPALPTVPPSNRSAPFTDVAIQPRTQSPIVSLRGGTGSPSALRGYERLPPTLFWLAGGQGKPITTVSWKTQRPKKRMNGLLGMTLHGLDAGTEYREKARTQDNGMSTGIGQDVPVVPQASKSVTEEKAESAKSENTYSSRSCSSLTSNTKSHTAQSSRSSRSGKVRREAQRETPLEPAPGEAAAARAEADHIPTSAAATEDQPANALKEDAPLVEDSQREPMGVDPQGETLPPNENVKEGQAAAEEDGGANTQSG
ncbi:hypothetical protein CC77DRAFT_1048099 [Alternaria alternata]|uniref:Uncharacterized protein n=2 Tax=Alternaria alternata complex TaxID=187734 RepID=A0A177DUD8_ALTAL|nr:hypothetical protein CC77DRAFT_1048099 [Alternaria alternata]OAG23146.1 hypothetical protein CC77DRAFT_1048099 [Alternaria alternata]